MTTADYAALGLLIVPLWGLSLKRGVIGGRTFNAMVSELRANRIQWDNAKLRSALMKWTRKPTAVVSMCEDEVSREIVNRHASEASARMRPWKTAITVWMYLGIAGVVGWLIFETENRTNQKPESTAPIHRRFS